MTDPRATLEYRAAVAALKAEGDARCWSCGKQLYAHLPKGHPLSITLGHDQLLSLSPAWRCPVSEPPQEDATTPRELPPHGTRSRYRLELKAGPGGKGGKACDRCKAANSEWSKNQRANAAASAARAVMHLVPDPPSTPEPEDASAPAEDASPPPPPEPGAMELAVEQDLAEIPATEQVPFHRSLSVLARQLAKEVDTADQSTARSRASSQLFDVLKALRSGRDGDASTALDIVLEDFGLPLVPQRPA